MISSLNFLDHISNMQSNVTLNKPCQFRTSCVLALAHLVQLMKPLINETTPDLQIWAAVRDPCQGVE